MTKKELYKNDLNHIFKSDLKHIYFVEKKHEKSLSKIIKVTTDPEIVQAVEEILAQTRENKINIEGIFKDLKIKPTAKTSRGIEGMISECREIIDKSEHLTYVIIDAALLSALQRILFYKLASYKTLKSYAELLSNKSVSKLLDLCYRDTAKAEKKLSRLLIKRVKPETVTLIG